MKNYLILDEVIDLSIKSVLNEITDNGFVKINELYNEIGRLLNFKCSDWHFCHLKYNWEKFINSLRETPINVFGDNANDIETRKFIRQCAKIEYPLSLKNKHISHFEMAKCLKDVLNYAYKIYGEYLNNIG